MVALNEQEKRVVELFRQLPADRRSLVILEMARGSADGWKRHRGYAQEQLALRARERGLDWERMTDEGREEFIADLLAEKGA